MVVKKCFLNGYLNVEVYLKQLHNFEHCDLLKHEFKLKNLCMV